VLYEDDLDTMKDGHGQVVLKLVPLPAVRHSLELAGRPLRTTPVRALSMDGPRVALAVSDPRGQCDRVVFWNVPWHFVARLTQPSGPTCLPKHEAGGIVDVAIAGSRAEWVTRYGRSTTLLAANIRRCQEWVVARLNASHQADRLGAVPGADRVVDLAGDGHTLIYALAGGTSSASHVGLVGHAWRDGTVPDDGTGVLQVSADRDRVAILRRDGTVAIATRGGRRIRLLRSGRALAIALRRRTLAVVTARGQLDLYNTTDGRRMHRWSAPVGVRSVDLQYGVALLTSARDIYVLNVATGRRARLAHTPTRVSAELEAPGIAYQFNRGSHGFVRFIPFSSVEAAAG
jgi:hypothetical protein